MDLSTLHNNYDVMCCLLVECGITSFMEENKRKSEEDETTILSSEVIRSLLNGSDYP